MAYGILCKYCGFQETEHYYPDLVEEESTIRREGYWLKLTTCIYKKGFTGEEEEPELTDFEMLCLEKEAERRAAWGYFAATVRQQNFNIKLAELNRNIREAGSSYDGEAVRQAEEEKEKYLRDCASQNGLCIG